MKKIKLLCVVFSFAFVGASFGPYAYAISLVCDPPSNQNVEYYKVFKKPVTDPVTTNWTEHETNVVPEADDSINYDLSGFDIGHWELTIEACNVRGCERAENPTFADLPSVVGAPQNTQVTP